MAKPSRPTGTSNQLEAGRAATAKVNVQLPATIVSYDSATQLATVKLVPRFRRRNRSQGNAVVTYDPPDITGVPVEFPGGGLFSITWPLAAGDSGLLTICDRSIDEWIDQGGTRTEPQDPRRHDLTDGVFRPGVRSPVEAIPAAGIDNSAMVIRAALLLLGSSAASDFAAMASLVLSELSSLWTALNLHTHATVTSLGTPTPPVGTPLGSASSVAATKVKVE